MACLGICKMWKIVSFFILNNTVSKEQTQKYKQSLKIKRIFFFCWTYCNLQLISRISDVPAVKMFKTFWDSWQFTDEFKTFWDSWQFTDEFKTFDAKINSILDSLFFQQLENIFFLPRRWKERERKRESFTQL